MLLIKQALLLRQSVSDLTLVLTNRAVQLLVGQVLHFLGGQPQLFQPLFEGAAQLRNFEEVFREISHLLWQMSKLLDSCGQGLVAILLLAQSGFVRAKLLVELGLNLVSGVPYLAVKLFESHVMHVFCGQPQLFKPLFERYRQLADTIHIFAEVHDDSRGLSSHLGGEVRLKFG